MYLYYSPSDWLATSEDIEGHLLKKINKKWLIEVNKLHDFNHNDFLWVGEQIIFKILKSLGPSSIRGNI